MKGALYNRNQLGVKLISVFLAGSPLSHEQYIIDIYIHRTTKLLTPINKSFVSMQVLTQNKIIQQFTAQTLHSALEKAIVRVGHSPYLLLL